MNRSSERSTQTIVDLGITSEYDDDTILRSLDIRDPKLEAIIRAYIHVRRDNLMDSKDDGLHSIRYWCCCG